VGHEGRDREKEKIKTCSKQKIDLKWSM
jgi:hypothetical protein